MLRPYTGTEGDLLMAHWAEMDLLASEIDGDRSWAEEAAGAIWAVCPAEGRRAADCLSRSAERLRATGAALDAVRERMGWAIALLPEEDAEIFRLYYGEGLTDEETGKRIFMSGSGASSRRVNKALAVYAAMRTMEQLKPTGWPLFDRWRDPAARGDFLKQKRPGRDLLQTAMYLWGAAPERIEALLRQLRQADPNGPEETGRIVTAIEWYARVWDGIDECLPGLTRPDARVLLARRFRERAPYDSLAKEFNCTEATVQDHLYVTMYEILGRVAQGTLDLVKWRQPIRRQWGGTAEKPLHGLEIPTGRSAVRLVDWRDVRKLLD